MCVCNIYMHRTSQVALVEKNRPVNAGDARDAILIPGLGRSPEVGNGNPFQYSCMENSMDRGAWWAKSPRSYKELDMTKQLSTYMYMCVCVNQRLETSLVVHWLRLQASNAGGQGPTSGQGTTSYVAHLRVHLHAATD